MLLRFATKHRSRAEQAGVTLLDQATNSVANFAIAILLARWLTPRDYGSYALAFAALLFAGGFQNALVLEPFSVFGAARYRASFRPYLTILATWQTAAALAVGAALVALAAIVPSLLPADLITNVHGVAIAMPAVFLAWLVRRAFYVARSPRGALVSTLVQCVCTLAGLVVVVRFTGLSGFTALLVIGAGALCGAAIGWIRLGSTGTQTSPAALPTAHVFAEHWRFGRWLALTNIAYWAAGQAFIIVTAVLLDVADVGAFTAMQNISAPVIVMINSLSVLILPWLAGRRDRLGSEWLQHSVIRVSLLLGGVALLGFLPLVAFGGHLTRLAYGGKYAGYEWILGYLVIARTITSVSIGLGIGLRSLEASLAVFLAYLYAAIFALLFAPVAAILWGLRGITLGIILGEAVLASALWIQWRRRIVATRDSRDGDTVPLPDTSG